MKIEKEHLTFSKPFSKVGYISPEIKSIQSIPSSVHYKTVYYSLAALILREEEAKEETKLHQILERAMNENPKLRCIMYL